MSNVEVRDGATDLGGEPEPTGDGIGKGIARDGRGIVVHRLAVSVGTAELEAVAHPLLDIHLKALIGGVGSKGQEADRPEVRVDPQILASRVIRPEPSRGTQRG